MACAKRSGKGERGGDTKNGLGGITEATKRQNIFHAGALSLSAGDRTVLDRGVGASFGVSACTLGIRHGRRRLLCGVNSRAKTKKNEYKKSNQQKICN